MSRISVSLRSGSVTRFFKLNLPNSARPLRAAVRADGITQSRGSVPEAVLPPTRPSELRSGLRGQAMNNLPADVDATPEPRVADHSLTPKRLMSVHGPQHAQPASEPRRLH